MDREVRKSLEKLNTALQLSESGQHSAVVEFLSQCSQEEIEDSPTLALLLGSALARLGRDSEGQPLIDIALARARERGDHAVELHALNARGAMALVTGKIDDAEEYFTNALTTAKRLDDLEAVGRSSNNLGIIEYYRGRCGRAVSAYNIALAAFQQVGSKRGVAEVEHNIGLTYREEDQLELALEQAGRAVRAANDAEDRALSALTLAAQAEVRALTGDTRLARREIDQALAIHRDLGDEPKESVDLRVLARILSMNDGTDEAEKLLRDVIGRAKAADRPKLVADANRDLARLLEKMGRPTKAVEVAREARVIYSEFGAEAEVRKLDKMIERMK